jgi:hypothetical protein
VKQSIWTRPLPDLWIQLPLTLAGVAMLIAVVGWMVWQPFRSQPIHEAAGGGDLLKVEELVRNGTPVNLEGPLDHTPIYYAYLNHHLHVVRYLLKEKADLKDILDLVVERKDLDLVRTIRSAGLKLDRHCFVNAIAEWIIRPFDEESIAELSSSKPDSPSGAGGVSEKADRLRDTEFADELLQTGGSIDCFYAKKGLKYREGGNALHIAVFNRDVPLVKYLLSRGANIDARTQDGSSSRGFHAGMTPIDVAEETFRVFPQTDNAGGPGVHYYSLVYPSPELARLLVQTKVIRSWVKRDKEDHKSAGDDAAPPPRTGSGAAAPSAELER